MENIDLSQVLPDGITTMISAGGILLLSAVIVMIIVIAKRWKGRFMPLLLGVIAYVLFVFICTNLITSAIALIPGADAAFTNNVAAYNLIHTLVTVIAFTIARITMAYMYAGRYERQGDIYLGGLGLGLGDAVLYGATAIYFYVMCNGIQYSGLQTLLESVPAEQVNSTYESIEALFVAPAFLWLLQGISCVMDLVLNLALLNMVYGAIKGYCPKWMIAVTAGVNLVSLLAFQLYDQSNQTNIVLWFAVKVIIFVSAMYYFFNIANREIKYSED